MFYKVGKNVIKYLLNICHFLQIFLVFLAFFTVFYWILKLAQAPFIPAMAPIFEPIRNFTHIFYQRTVTSGDITIDFSFLIAALTMLLIVWLLNFAINFFDDLEKKYEKMCESIRKNEENLLNKTLEFNSKQLAQDDNKFLLLLSFKLVNIMHDAKYNTNIENEHDKKVEEVMETFSEKIQSTLKCTKKSLDNSILIYFDNFSEIDTVLTQVIHILSIIKTELANEKWKFGFISAIEVYSKNSEVVEKCKSLFALNKLNLINEIICLASFNQRYKLMKNPIFQLNGKGVYKINNNEIEVYSLGRKNV